MHRSLPPALLLFGLVASVASSVPPDLEEFENSNVDRGPVLELGPEETARFRLLVEAPTPAAGARLAVEALRLDEAPADSGVDSASDTGRETGFFQPSQDVGLILSLSQRDQELAGGGPEGRSGKASVRATLLDIFGGCVGSSATVSATSGQNGSCTVELDFSVFNTKSTATRVIWGASVDQESTWQPCDEDGEPEGCLDEPPPSDVKVRILALP
jgi:hypothetical protein